MMAIRMAKQRDAATVAAMSRELIEFGLGWSWTPPRVARSITSRDTNVIVAEVNGGTVGFALMQYFEEHAHLLLFAVAPASRRQGVGRALWAWLESTAQVAGISTVHLEVRARNREARDFYHTLGFVDAETVRGYYRGVEAAIRMRHCLADIAQWDRS
jgi:ribosomal-protein-alanine N-acetyltransferase